MNLFSKMNLLGWYAGQKVKHAAKRVYNLSLTNEKSWDPSLWNLIGSQSISGEDVTESTALTYSAVFNAVTLISGTISTLPLHLMQKTGKSNQIADHKSIYRIMHDQWNPYMTSEVGRAVMMSHILTWGNGYAEKVRDGMGNLTALWPIPPNRIQKMQWGVNGEIIYDIQIDGKPNVKLSREQVLHIPGLGFDGFQGYSVIAMARKSIGLGMAMETFGSRYFGEGTHPSATISHPNHIKDNKLREALKHTYAGLGKSHRLMLLEDGMELKNIGIPPGDSQFIESKIHHISDIARWFNLPPHKLKDLSKSSFNNIESEQLSYYGDCILLWLVRLEQNYNMQLLLPNEQKQKLYFKHAIEGLLRANSKDRALYHKIMIGTGLETLNEGRAKEDMNPIADPLADELWMPTGLIPLSKFDKYLVKNTGKGPFQESIKEEPKAKLKLLDRKT